MKRAHMAHSLTHARARAKIQADAAKAYDAAARFVIGDRAVVNFRNYDHKNDGPPRRPPDWVVKRIREMVRSILCSTRRAKLTQSPQQIRSTQRAMSSSASRFCAGRRRTAPRSRAADRTTTTTITITTRTRRHEAAAGAF